MFSFPNPVNEVAARTVAAGVALLCVATLVLSLAFGPGWLWLTALLAYGFIARVLTGPTLSPLGRFATAIAAPNIGREKLVAGPPKRFAQGIGATLSVTALVAHFALGANAIAAALVAMVLVAATLESVFAYCLGCKAFALLMRAGIVPARTCEACANISLRTA